MEDKKLEWSDIKICAFGKELGISVLPTFDTNIESYRHLITYDKISSLEDLPQCLIGTIGVAHKLYNYQDIEPCIIDVLKNELPIISKNRLNVPYEVKEINVYHKPKSKFKYLIIRFKTKETTLVLNNPYFK